MRKGLFPNEEYNTPATEDEISEAEECLGRPIPSEVKEFYRTYDGIDSVGPASPFRLMPLAELIETQPKIEDHLGAPILFQELGLTWFWTDDQSNYLGLFTSGALAGKISYFDHEAYYCGDRSPLFRNLDSLQAKLGKISEWNWITELCEDGKLSEEEANAAYKKFPEFRYADALDVLDIYDVDTDYPCSELTTESDKGAYRWIRLKFADIGGMEDSEKQFIGLTVSRLAPADELEIVHQMMGDKDLDICGDLLQHLFLRGDTRSLPSILKYARHGAQADSAHATLSKFIFTGRATREEVVGVHESHGGNVGQLEYQLEYHLNQLREYPSFLRQW